MLSGGSGLTISSSSLNFNSAVNSGGAVYVTDSNSLANIINCNFNNNSCSSSKCSGMSVVDNIFFCSYLLIATIFT